MTKKERFLKIVKTTIQRPGIDSLMEWLDSTDFYVAPASTKYHLCCQGGLLTHSLNVYDSITKLNDAINLNFSPETLAIVALFHDLCKVNFYKPELKSVKVGSSWVQKEGYSIEDQLPLGHGEKSCICLLKHMRLTNEELLAIRWHMGGFDTAVKGGDYALSTAQSSSKLVSLLQIADQIATYYLDEEESK